MRPHNESWLNRPKLVAQICCIKKADGTQPAKCCQGASEMHLTLLGHSQCSEGARISAQALGLAWNRSFMEYGYIFGREGCNVHIHMYEFTYLRLCIERLRLLWMRDLWLVSKYLAMWTSCIMSLHLIVPRNYWCQTTYISLYVYVHLRQFRNKLWPRAASRLHPLA